jgi:hypothetical protein
MPKIIVHEPNLQPIKFRVSLDKEEILIGGLKSNHICLSSSKVSSKHCKLLRTEFGYKLIDLNSTYGTMFNGEMIEGLDITKNMAFYVADVFIQLEFNAQEYALLKKLIPLEKSQINEIEPENRSSTVTSPSPQPQPPLPTGRSFSSETIRVHPSFLKQVSLDPSIPVSPPPSPAIQPIPALADPIPDWEGEIETPSRPSNPIFSDEATEKIEGIAHEGFLLNFDRDFQTSEIRTKFGGFPDWLKSPAWPLDSSDNEKQLRFIAQFKIDPEIFPNSKAKFAYFFLRDREDELSFVHECVVVLQPGPKPNCEIVKKNHGPTLQKLVSRKGYKTKLFPEDFRQTPGLVPITERDFHLAAETREPLSKVGGNPEFVNSKNYPDTKQEWQLLFQLNRNTLPCELGIVTNGVCFGFINPEGTECRVIVQRR